jgi:hypothetical protein
MVPRVYAGPLVVPAPMGPDSEDLGRYSLAGGLARPQLAAPSCCQ